jgi:hypothetical protein
LRLDLPGDLLEKRLIQAELRQFLVIAHPRPSGAVPVGLR